MRISDWSSDVCSSDLTAPCLDAHSSLRGGQPGAGYTLALMQKFHHRRAVDQRHTEIEGRTQQPGNQRISVDVVHAAPMQEKIADVPRKPSGNVERRTRSARGAEEITHVGSTGQPDDQQTCANKRCTTFIRTGPKP